jgi:peptide chain release factor 1
MTTIPAEKLDRLVTRWQTVQGTLASGTDQESFVRLSREFSDLNPIVTTINALRKATREREDLQQLLDDPASDKEMAALAREELAALGPKLDELERQLKVALLPKDNADEKSAILEVRAGTGGDEAALFAGNLFRMYQRYAEQRGWKVSILSASESATGGYKEIIASITGKGVFARLKFESGVHRVQRVPDTEAQGRIHTSAATVAVLPEAEEVDIKIEDKDLRIDVFRSSGPGGQSVNTTDSAVRITHIPTGVVASCQNERSQLQNKAQAMRILKSRLIEREEELRLQALAKERGEAQDISFGSQIRSYVLHPYTMVNDHRTNMKIGNAQGVLDGDLAPFIRSYLMAKKTKPTTKTQTFYNTSGRHVMTLVTFIVKRKSFQTERVQRALLTLYPDGTDGISTAAIHRRVVAELKSESEQAGLRDPSPATIGRLLGRR